jgi:hypothetical protein
MENKFWTTEKSKEISRTSVWKMDATISLQKSEENSNQSMKNLIMLVVVIMARVQ